MIFPRTSMKIFRAGIALSLVFWVAGLGCVFGCESLATSAPGITAAEHHLGQPDATTIVSGDSCASRADHSCCAKHRAASRHRKTTDKATSAPDIRSSLVTSSLMLDMAGGVVHQCPLALNTRALASKARSDESTTFIAFQPASLPLVSVGQLTVPSAPAFLNNRGHTYLRCCVFLI